MDEAWIGFVGVGVGAMITPVIEWIRANFKNRKNAKYLAIHVVCVLDDFILRCADTVYYSHEQDQDDCYRNVPSPMAPVFPTELDWTSITHSLSYSVLSLQNKISFANSLISGMAQLASPPFEDVAEEKQYQFSRIALFAAEIEQKFRFKFDLPNDNQSQWVRKDWDLLEYFKKTETEINNLRQNRLNQKII